MNSFNVNFIEKILSIGYCVYRAGHLVYSIKISYEVEKVTALIGT